MKKPLATLSTASSPGDIYGLILGLTAAEKTAIRRAWGKNGSRKLPLHVHFFEQIVEGRAADDGSAQAVLGLSGGAQFSNLKQHLMAEVLDTLVLALRNESPETQLHLGIMQLRLLVERCHHGIARRLCKKLFAIANETGNYGLVLEVLYFKRQLIEQRSYRQYVAETDEIAQLINRYASYQQAVQQMQCFMDRLRILRANDQLQVSEENHETVRQIIDQLASLNSVAASTPHLRIRHLAATATANHMLQRFDACNGYCKEALVLLEHHDSLVSVDPDSFLTLSSIAFYNEFARNCSACVADWLVRFDRIAELNNNTEYFQKSWAIIRFHTSLKIAHKTADYERVELLVDKESSTILAYAAQVRRASEALTLIASILISYFVLERFHEAESLMLELKERNRSLERQDIFYFTLVFHLLILFELKDWYRLDTATVAAYHVLYNRRKLRPFEKELMSFLKAVPTRRGHDRASYIKSFVARLEVYRNDPVQRLYLLYFNYYDWLQSKLAGVSYMEYKKQLFANACASS